MFDWNDEEVTLLLLIKKINFFLASWSFIFLSIFLF